MSTERVAEVLRQARDLLRDNVEPFRWEDNDLLAWLNTGEDQIARRRPDSMFVNDIVCTEPTKKKKPDSLEISNQFVPALVNYIVYRALSRDSEHSANKALGDYYLQQYLGELA